MFLLHVQKFKICLGVNTIKMLKHFSVAMDVDVSEQHKNPSFTLNALVCTQADLQFTLPVGCRI